MANGSIYLKGIQTISNLISSLTIIVTSIAVVSNKSLVKDFILKNFKLPVLFLTLALLLLFLLLLYQVKKRDIAKPPGKISEDEEKRITDNINYNTKINRTKIGVWVAVVVVFIWLIVSQFQNREFGILQGAISAEKRFGDNIKGKVKKFKPLEYGIDENEEIDYGDIDDKQTVTEKFKNQFNNGVVYSAQYNQTDSIINLKLLWVGISKCFSDSIYIQKEFQNCDLVFNDDASMISNFILGFVYMHGCDTLESIKYFDNVLKTIESTPDPQRKLVLEPLGEWINRYYVYVRKEKNNDTISDYPRLFREINNDTAYNFIRGYFTDTTISIKKMVEQQYFKCPLFVLSNSDKVIIFEYDLVNREYIEYHSDSVYYGASGNTAQNIITSEPISLSAEGNTKINRIGEDTIEKYISKKFPIDYRRFRIDRQFLIKHIR